MLNRKALSPNNTVDARKTPLGAEEAWHLLEGASEIIVAKGKNVLILTPKEDSKEAILKEALGRSGTLRAPTLRIGDRLLVGYSDTLYSLYLG